MSTPARGLVCVECGRLSDRPTTCSSCTGAAERAAIARDELMHWKRSPSLAQQRL